MIRLQSTVETVVHEKALLIAEIYAYDSSGLLVNPFNQSNPPSQCGNQPIHGPQQPNQLNHKGRNGDCLVTGHPGNIRQLFDPVTGVGSGSSGPITWQPPQSTSMLPN